MSAWICAMPPAGLQRHETEIDPLQVSQGLESSYRTMQGGSSGLL